jgi:phosphatidylinositol-3-phosphatase
MDTLWYSKILIVLLLGLLGACNGATVKVQPTLTPTVNSSPAIVPSETPTLPSTAPASPTAAPLVPDFKHIVVILFENHEFDVVAGSRQMPNFNAYAEKYTLLTQYYAVTHPSLPNYIALFSGDTWGITTDCSTCFKNVPSLPDQLEVAGKTWKAYLEDMPSPCYVGDTATYVQKHDPFIYFDPIRLDLARCANSVLPLSRLSGDLGFGTFPDFAFIMPNICNSAHDAAIDPACSLKHADTWLAAMIWQLQSSLDPSGEPYLIVVTWDEGQGNHSCCGLPEDAGGRVATLLISPQAKAGFRDDTAYTHYSLLKTIETAWGLPRLGHDADDSNVLITAPWK